ncbi:hypothetical protein OBCHQ24_15505 [Oceanobacillus iheyensis]|nr:hypothetical protein OBCHQ24_15505 [Oceanobacillus iheyensis]
MIYFNAIIGGLLFSSLIYLFVFFLFAKRKKLTLLEWFLLSVATFNGLIFSFVMWATFVEKKTFDGISWLLEYDNKTIFTFFTYNIILVFAVLFGWGIAASIRNSLNKDIHKYTTNDSIDDEKKL